MLIEGLSIANVICMIFRFYPIFIMLLFSILTYAQENQSLHLQRNHANADQSRIPTIVMIVPLDQRNNGLVLEEIFLNEIGKDLAALYPKHTVEMFYIRKGEQGTNKDEVLQNI